MEGQDNISQNCEDGEFQRGIRLSHFTIEHSPDSIIWVDQYARIQRANPAACKTYGYSAKEMTSISIHDLDPSYPRESWEETWKEFKSEKYLQLETVGVTKTGRNFPVEIHAYYFEFEGEEYACVYSRDITQRTLAEANARFSHFTIEHAPDLIFWCDRNALIQHANKTACQVYGYSFQEMTAMSIFDLDPTVTPESWEANWEAIKSEGASSIESEGRTKDGRVFPIEVKAHFLEFEGTEFLCSFVRDISKRKAREENARFSHFTIEHAPDLIFWSDRNANIKHANEAACETYGYSSEELTQMKVFDLNPNMEPENWESFWETLKKKETMVVESKGKTKNGKVFPTEVKAHYLEFEGEEFACAFIFDITNRIKEQEERKRLATEKERFESELKIATLVQNDFLPEKPPERFDIDFAAKTIPAKFVGGDFYDFIPLGGDLLAIVLGDVAGKGVSAALYMARLLSDFRHVAPMMLAPAQTLTEVNRILAERSRRGMFATTLFLFLDLETKCLTVSNAGHHPLIIKKKDKVAVNWGNASGAPIGIIPCVDYQQEEIQLESGDLVFAYTDGASEPMNADGEQFGITRIKERIANFSGSAQELINQLEKDIIQFVGDKPAHDDLTFIAFQVK